YRHDGVSSVIPENRKITQEFLVDDAQSMKAKNLDIVRIKITEYPGENNLAKAEVSKDFGEDMTVDIEIMQAILEHNIPHKCSKETEVEIDAIPDTVTDKECAGRKDYRNVPLVTIDEIGRASCREKCRDRWSERHDKEREMMQR